MCEISEFVQLNMNGQGVSQDNIGLKVNHGMNNSYSSIPLQG